MEQETFKKPLLIGKVGKLPKKILKKDIPETVANTDKEAALEKSLEKDSSENVGDTGTAQQLTAELSYKEPEWSGTPDPDRDYALEVLKSGQIVDRIALTARPFVVIGRLDDCDVTMAHPTISRYHAVLQYRETESDDDPKGFYLYDLSSTHGTFLNKRRLKPRVYAKVYVGHMIRLGCSTRTYLLVGPPDDVEAESTLSVTELKRRRAEELEARRLRDEELARKAREDADELERRAEERGVDWGMGDDADEESDLPENPYAQTNNEELYVDDPKKALRGFFEREGLDLEYDCTEQGPGQFLCKVQLPLDDERGRPIFAEIVHKGKKKETVVQCALEACRVLDRHGVLRQAIHESRKRKAKNWEENDFYDSDDDTFLDRTGIIERKRENRMKNKVPQQPETYQSLVEKEEKLRKEIETIETKLVDVNKSKKHLKETAGEDSLDSFMKQLKSSSNKLDKEKIGKLKIDLQKSKNELETVKKLLGIAKPTHLPALVNESKKETKTLAKRQLPIYGKRLKVKVNLPPRSEVVFTTEDDEETEVEKEEQAVKETEKPVIPPPVKKSTNDFIKDWNKIEINFNRTYPLMPHNHEHYVSSIWKNLKRLHPEYPMEIKEELVKMFTEYVNNSSSIIGQRFANEIDFITSGIKLAENGADVSKLALKILQLAKELTHMINENEKNQSPNDSDDDCSDSKDLAGKYGSGDQLGDNYSMWVPPADQTGDGRTSLNDKFGY